MTTNRVQFQAGLSMAEFMDRYGSDDKCEAALIASRWPSGFACPACGCGHSSSFRRQGRLYFVAPAKRLQPAGMLEIRGKHGPPNLSEIVL